MICDGGTLAGYLPLRPDPNEALGVAEGGVGVAGFEDEGGVGQDHARHPVLQVRAEFNGCGGIARREETRNP